ncbi:MAG TPA: site-specific integrase, partial [Methylophaga sp.]|nr:site-specific integrase [Methylophaga sp.]
DCKQSVIDDTRQTIWESIYAQQVELRQIDDIGPSGQERVERDINRCKKVLSDLGADPERLSRHG